MARRTREVGIRVALGATSRDVISLLVGGGMKVVVLGVGLGLLMAIGTGQLVQRFLYGVSGLDPVAFTGIPTVLLAVSFLAALLPAHRATSIDPVDAASLGVGATHPTRWCVPRAGRPTPPALSLTPRG